jgi:hypothetical protein
LIAWVTWGKRESRPRARRTGRGLTTFSVPVQILIAFVAKLRLYGIWSDEGPFAELSRILEKGGATDWSGAAGASGLVGAHRIGRGADT